VTSLFAILDHHHHHHHHHTRSRRGVPNLLFKFDFGILITFGYIAILVFCHFACKMPNHAHFLVNFRGSYPQNLTLIILTPKGTSLAENASFEPSRKIYPGVRPGRVPEKKSQNRKGQPTKRHNNVIFHICGEKPPLMILQPNLARGRCPGRNHTCQILRWKFKGFRFYGGRILAFYVDFAYGPHCCATALPVIRSPIAYV